MAKRKIALYPHKSLRKEALLVADVNDEIRTILNDMAETMYRAQGIGLSGPQIDVNKRLVVVHVPYTERVGNKQVGQPSGLYQMVNPSIIKLSPKEEIDMEGCLSLPGVQRGIKRPAEIVVKYVDIIGEDKVLTATGLLARAIQHEVDHLDGKLIIDYEDLSFAL